MIEFRAARPIWTDRLELYAKQTINGETFAIVAAGIEVKPIEKGLVWPLFVDIPIWQDDSGQSLFDALWSVGYRPHSGESSSAHVEAMKYHLEDMRKLVFK